MPQKKVMAGAARRALHARHRSVDPPDPHGPLTRQRPRVKLQPPPAGLCKRGPLVQAIGATPHQRGVRQELTIKEQMGGGGGGAEGSHGEPPGRSWSVKAEAIHVASSTLILTMRSFRPAGRFRTPRFSDLAAQQGGGAQQERRIDRSDGRAYTRREFEMHYRGLAEWNAAPLCTSPSLS